MEPTQPIVGIYHKNCSGNDGQTAAAVLLKKFPHAETLPLPHGYLPEDIDPILECITPDTDVYILDTSQGVVETLEKAHSVTIVDHHISEKEKLDKSAAENNRLTYIFDNDKSGSSLAWSYFFPDKPLPRLIELVEDYDLWKQRFGNDTEYLHYVLDKHKDQPQEVLKLFDANLDEVLQRGKVIAEYVLDVVNKYVEEREPLTLLVGDYAVSAYNGVFFKNNIADEFLKKTPSEPIIIFTVDGPMVNMAIRSLGESAYSALDVASFLGGSGHRNASGARISLDRFFEMIQKTN